MGHRDENVKPLRRGFAWIAATLASGALVALFFHPILARNPLAGFDWVMSASYYDWARTSFIEYGSLPLYMAGAAHSFNLIANPQSPVLGPLIWLLVFLPTGTYLKILLIGYATLGLTGMFALLREHGVSPEIAAFAGVVFTFNGFFVAHFAVGHPFALGAYLLPGLLLLFERAHRGSGGALWGAAAANVLVLLEGANHPFIWQNVLLLLLAAAWCLESRSLRPAWTWLRFLGLSLGLGAFKLLPMLAEFHSYAPAERNLGFPPAAALWSLVHQGQNAVTSYPGLAFQLGTGWWEYAFYLGVLPFVFVVAGLTAARRCWPLLLAGAFFLAISLDVRLGGMSLSAWTLIDDLPIWRTQRVPSRFLLVAVFAFLVAAASGIQRLLDQVRERRVLSAALRGAVALTAILVFVDLRSQSEAWQQDSSQGQPVSLDYRPPILLVPAAPGSRVRFSRFTPNRFAVEVRSAQTAHLVLAGERWIRKDNWRIEGGTMESVGERVGVRVAPGEHEVLFRYLPRFFPLGLTLSGLTLVAGLLQAFGLRVRRRPSPADRSR
jgi:hypothetical protein